MARNPRGVPAQASSPASAPIRACHPGGATGTASSTRAAPAARAIWQPARAVDPVAMPSPATTATQPPSGSRGRTGRYHPARASTSARARAWTAASTFCDTPAQSAISGLMTGTPSSPTAPVPGSGRDGTPSLRTTMTSSPGLRTWGCMRAVARVMG